MKEFLIVVMLIAAGTMVSKTLRNLDARNLDPYFSDKRLPKFTESERNSPTSGEWVTAMQSSQ